MAPAFVQSAAPSGEGSSDRLEATQTVRILLIAEQYYPPTIGGSAITVRQLAGGLAARGHRVAVVAPAVGLKSTVEEEAGGFTVLRAPSIPSFFVPNQSVSAGMRTPVFPGPTVEKAFGYLEPDIVHTQLPAFIGVAAGRYAAEREVPVIATLHSLPENAIGAGNPRNWLFKAVSMGFWEAVTGHCRRASQVSAPSRLARSLLLDHGVPGPIEVISNGVDVHRFRPAASPAEKLAARQLLGWPVDRRLVLYVGRLASEKRVDVLLGAIRQLPADLDAHAVLVGKGDDTFLALAEQMGLASRCTFHGPISDELLPLAYRAADIFAFPSEAELQGMVLLEAAASGLPIVAADRYAIPEIVHHGVNGYLHPPGDAEACAGAIEQVLRSERVHRRMSRLAVRFAADHALEDVAERTEALYESAIAARRGALARTA